MSKIVGTTIIDTIVPPATTSTFPTHDSQYGKGGWRELDNWEQVALIPRSRMRAGMAVSIAGLGAYTLSHMGDTVEEDEWSPIRGERGERGERGPAGSLDNFVIMTEAEYNNLPEKDLNIIYCLYEVDSEDNSDAEVLGEILDLNAEIDEMSIEIIGEIENNLLIL